MAKEKLVPMVFFAGVLNGQQRTGFGYLVKTPDGTFWCFHDEKSAAGNPFESGAIRLDPNLLKEVPSTTGKRQLFLYQKVLGDPPRPNSD